MQPTIIFNFDDKTSILDERAKAKIIEIKTDFKDKTDWIKIGNKKQTKY